MKDQGGDRGGFYEDQDDHNVKRDWDQVEGKRGQRIWQLQALVTTANAWQLRDE